MTPVRLSYNKPLTYCVDGFYRCYLCALCRRSKSIYWN